MKVRSDAWSHEDDLLLAETVLRHIREGSTQLNAFEEVGDKLNRTSAACGFRWNAEIRKHYEQAVSLAKKQRKEFKRAQANEHKHIIEGDEPARSSAIHLVESQNTEMAAEFSPNLAPSTTLTMTDVIVYLQQLDEQKNNQLLAEHQELQKENQQLKSKLADLETKYQQLIQRASQVEEDYKTILTIMNRARKMVTTEEVHHELAPIFKVDENGNLEIV